MVAAHDVGWVMAEREGTSVVEDVRRITQNTTYRELINHHDDELARRFDLLLAMGSHELTLDHYRDEIQAARPQSGISAWSGSPGRSSCSPSCWSFLRSCRGSQGRSTDTPSHMRACLG